MALEALWRLRDGDYYLYDHYPDHLVTVDVLPNADDDEDTRAGTAIKGHPKKVLIARPRVHAEDANGDSKAL